MTTNIITWKGAKKYFKVALITTLMASIGTAGAANNYNSDVQIEQAVNQHKVLAYNTFSDVRGNHLFFSDIEWATEFKTDSGSNLMVGLGNNKFGPDHQLTEEQFATMVARFYNVTESNSGLTSASLGTWSDGVYSALAPYGVPLAGYKNKDKRDDPITRGQMAQIIAHIAGQSNDLENAVDYLMKTGISSGVRTDSSSKLENFDYKGVLTRGQTAAFFKRLHSKGQTNLEIFQVGTIEQGISKGIDYVDDRLDKKTTTSTISTKHITPVKQEKIDNNSGGILKTGYVNSLAKPVEKLYKDSGFEIRSAEGDSMFLVVKDKDHHMFSTETGEKWFTIKRTNNVISYKIAAKSIIILGANVSEGELLETIKNHKPGKATEIGNVRVDSTGMSVLVKWK